MDAGHLIPGSAAEVLRAWPGGARKRFGQHFLCSDGIVERILAAAELRPGDPVLEVGPGPGVLSAALLRAGARLTAVEIDPDCAAHTARLLPGARIVQADALGLDLGALLPGPGVRCVSNLPYNVGTRLLLRMLERSPPFERLVLMLQREVGLRLLAQPGEASRGSLSVAVQARARVERICRVPAGCFLPPPKVESVVLRLWPRAAPPPARLDELLRLGFAAPRKTLWNNLRAGLGGDAAESLLARAGLEGGRRPAELSQEEWGRLAALDGAPDPGSP